jgi:hypothetical protein
MNASQLYVLIALIALVAIAAVGFFLHKDVKAPRLTLFARLALVCVLAGILFGENRWLGYGLLGVGIVLALIDIINKSRHQPR